jgi:hypothetical protein
VRRIVTLLGVATVMLVVVAGAAVAINKTCRDIPCRGTNNRDVLHERTGNVRDRILGLDGRDRIEAATFRNERDRVDGGRQADRLLTNDGDGRDAARGGRGRDTCLIDQGDSSKSCERLQRATAAQAGVIPSWFDDSTTGP